MLNFFYEYIYFLNLQLFSWVLDMGALCLSKNNLLDTMVAQLNFLTSRQKTYIKIILKNLPEKQQFLSHEVAEALILLSLADVKKLLHFYYDLLSIQYSGSFYFFS